MIGNVKIKGDKCHSPSLQIVELVKSQIKAKTLFPGEKLPTIQEFAEILGASQYSVCQAFTKLSRDGAVKTVRGVGTFVADDFMDSKESPKTSRTICIISAFSSNGYSMGLTHPITTTAILDTCKEIHVKGRFFSPNISISSLDDVVEELRDRQYDGAIWLYPTNNQWPLVEALYNREIPTVATMYAQYAINFPSIQMNEVGTGQSVGRYAISRGCDKMFSFVSDALPFCTPRFDLHEGRNLGIFNAFKEAGKDTPQITEVHYTRGDNVNYVTLLKKAVENSDKKTFLLLANTDEFQKHLAENPDEVADLLSKCEFVIASAEKKYHFLDPLAKRMEFMVCISPLEQLGAAAANKLFHLIEGKFENTITLVNQTIEKFDINKKI